MVWIWIQRDFLGKRKIWFFFSLLPFFTYMVIKFNYTTDFKTKLLFRNRKKKWGLNIPPWKQPISFSNNKMCIVGSEGDEVFKTYLFWFRNLRRRMRDERAYKIIVLHFPPFPIIVHLPFPTLEGIMIYFYYFSSSSLLFFSEKGLRDRGSLVVGDSWTQRKGCPCVHC